MLNNVNTNLERIIAKIDNDFNPDNSDWIPRVGAWCIDAMSQLNVLRTKRKKKKIVVKNRIARSECPINNSDIKIYDNKGCEIKKASDSPCCDNDSLTGKFASETSDIITNVTANTINIVNTGQSKGHPYVFAETVNDKYPYRYNIKNNVLEDNNIQERNYVLIGSDVIELNFDTNFIYIETEYIETICSESLGCEVPVIPNNGLLIEAISYYCIYKMLCRGYKHPVFNLQNSYGGTNPFVIWNQLKDEAKRSVVNNNIDDGSDLFRSNLFINTFDPRK